MFDFPSVTQIFTTIAFLIALVITPILAFTGYGWSSLYFLIGIPLVTCVLGLLIRAIGDALDDQ